MGDYARMPAARLSLAHTLWSPFLSLFSKGCFDLKCKANPSTNPNTPTPLKDHSELKHHKSRRKTLTIRTPIPCMYIKFSMDKDM